MSKTAKEIRQAVEKAQTVVKPEETTFFGQQVWVWPLSSFEMEAWRQYVRSKDETEQRKNVAKLIQISLRTESGEYIYDPAAVDQIAGFKPARELDRIEEIAMRVNGYGPAGVEEILKNLSTSPGNSGSAGSLPGSEMLKYPGLNRSESGSKPRSASLGR